MSYDSDVAAIKAKVTEIKQKSFELWVELGLLMFDEPKSLDYLDDSFKPFYERNPQPLVSMMGDLDKVKAELEDPATEKMDTVKGDIQDWQGSAAETFVENFLTPFPKTVTNQVEIVVELHGALNACKEILDRGRKDAITVADNAIAALKRGLEIDDKNDTGMLLTIAGAVVAVAAAIPSAGTSLGAYALGMGLVGSAVSISSASVAAKPITGTDPDTILLQLDDALRELSSGMTQEEDILAGVLQKDAGVIDANMRKVLPARPELADDPGADFSLPTNPGS